MIRKDLYFICTDQVLPALKMAKNPRGGLAPLRTIPNAMNRFKEKAGKILIRQ